MEKATLNWIGRSASSMEKVVLRRKPELIVPQRFSRGVFLNKSRIQCGHIEIWFVTSQFCSCLPAEGVQEFS